MRRALTTIAVTPGLAAYFAIPLSVIFAPHQFNGLERCGCEGRGSRAHERAISNLGSSHHEEVGSCCIGPCPWHRRGFGRRPFAALLQGAASDGCCDVRLERLL